MATHKERPIVLAAYSTARDAHTSNIQAEHRKWATQQQQQTIINERKHKCTTRYHYAYIGKCTLDTTVIRSRADPAKCLIIQNIQAHTHICSSML